MKRDVVVIKERFETVDLEALEGPALCLRKKHMEARLSDTGATDDEHYFARREVQRIDAELSRRKEARRAQAASPERLGEHERFLHAFFQAAKEVLPAEVRAAVIGRAAALVATGEPIACAQCGNT